MSETQTVYAFWQHRTSGKRYAVRLEEPTRERQGGVGEPDYLLKSDYSVTGACGPLHHSELRAVLLPDFHYDDEPDLASDLGCNEAQYRFYEAEDA